MNYFTCPLCYNQREFRRFSKFFRHITIFHQNDSKFTITCNLTQTCGTLYRTFSAYKSHVYRHHQTELHPVYQQPPNTHSHTDHQQQDSIEENIESDSTEDSVDEDVNVSGVNSFDFQAESDSDSDPVEELFGANNHQENHNGTMGSIMESFVLFMLQLREDFLLPKFTMNTITNYIITLIESLQMLLRRNAVPCQSDGLPSSSSTPKLPGEMISLKSVKEIVHDVCRQLQDITKNEYRFTQHCHELFGYDSPVEIIITDPNSDEKPEKGYLIPIGQTLSRMLANDHILSGIVQHLDQEKRSIALDDDLMFSFRDAHFGARIDDDSLLIQLYLDDIGVTNPIGAKRDSNKLTMIYFSLEDIPDKHRSKLDSIQLLAICSSNVLKVKSPRDLIANTSKFLYRVNSCNS